MKGDFKLKVLETICGGFESIDDILAAILTAPYGSSYHKLEWYANANRRERERREYEAKKRQRIYELISKLRKEGFIEKAGISGKYSATSKGHSLLQKIKKIRKANPPLESYQAEKDSVLKIVLFDVPENKRWKRAWLRGALSNLKFRMLQKSVWVGKSKIPEDFLNDLAKLGLVPFVQILAISKTGSLKEVDLNLD